MRDSIADPTRLFSAALHLIGELLTPINSPRIALINYHSLTFGRASQPTAPRHPFTTMGTAQDIVAAINKLRTTPTAFIPYLEARLARFEGNQIKPLKAGDPYMLTSEGPAVVEETIAFLKSAQPVGALTLSPELSAAAQDHVNDTGPKGITGHDGSDGSTSEARIERYCDWEMTIGENLDYGNTAADDIVMALCVDDGVPSRGHRNVG